LSDQCPHRSAPLSIGSMVDGKLECKYHGWQFGEDGECLEIPSIDRKPTSANRAISYPCIERYTLVWVWVGDAEKATEDKLPDMFFDEMSDPDYMQCHGSRDLEIDHGLMVENLLDPAHLPFTHDGTISSRKDITPMKMTVLYDNISIPGRTVDNYDKEGNQTEKSRQKFRDNFKGMHGKCEYYQKPDKNDIHFIFVPPCFVKIDLQLGKKGSKMIQMQMCVPVTRTKMRFLYIFNFNFIKWGSRIPGFNHLFTWNSDKVIEQDVELLAGQQYNLLHGAKAWNSSVRADSLGVRYRKWRSMAEVGRPWFEGFSCGVKGAVDIEDLVQKNPTPPTDISRLRHQIAEIAYIESFASPKSRFKPRESITLFPSWMNWKLMVSLAVVGVSAGVAWFLVKNPSALGLMNSSVQTQKQ